MLALDDNNKLAVKTWAQDMLKKMDLNLFMVLSALVDILEMLNRFNKNTQPRSAKDQLTVTKQEFQNLIVITIVLYTYGNMYYQK